MRSSLSGLVEHGVLRVVLGLIFPQRAQLMFNWGRCVIHDYEHHRASAARFDHVRCWLDLRQSYHEL